VTTVKYDSKEALVQDIEREYAALVTVLDGIPVPDYREAGVWGDGWTVNDLIAHLSAWHRLFLGWHRDGLAGRTPAMPAQGYRWNETPRLNHDIWRRHKDRPTDELRAELESTHGQALHLARELSEAQILEPGAFAWTGRNALVTYLGANTASHCRFAQKVLKRWLKNR
jgi:hypothetical protein